MKLPLGENETCPGRANKIHFEDETKIRNSLRNQVDIIFLRKSSLQLSKLFVVFVNSLYNEFN